MLILVTGNIGVGKTTFLNNLNKDNTAIFTSSFVSHTSLITEDKDEVMKSGDYYRIQLWNINAMNKCEHEATLYSLTHQDKDVYVDRGLESVYIFTELYHDLNYITDEQYNNIIYKLNTLPRVKYNKVIYMHENVDILYARIIKRNRDIDSWVNYDILHRLQCLYDNKYDNKLCENSSQ